MNSGTYCIYDSNLSHLILLQEIAGLQNCLQLEKLYLYDNQIYEITNLEMQSNLEVLWLNNNCITQIQVCHGCYVSIQEFL